MPRRILLHHLAIASILSGVVTNETLGIVYWQSDFGIVDPLAQTGSFPTDLLHPDQSITARVLGASGSVIAPNWILSAAHVLKNGVGNPAALYEVDGTYYKAKLDANGEPLVFLHPTYVSPSIGFDVALVRIVTQDGQDADLDSWVSIGTEVNVLPGIAVTIGGYGGRGYLDEVTGQLFPFGSGQLRWGRNTVHSLLPSQLTTNMRNPTHPDYIKYEATLRPGDSGSGWFARDGWEWKHIAETWGTLSTTDSLATNVTVPGIFDWIQETMSNEYPTTPSPQPKPGATTSWIGSSNGDWNDPANWSDGLPRFDEGRADVVSLEVSILSTASAIDISSAATAQDVFIGGIGTNKTLNVNSGGHLTADALFFGGDSLEIGTLIQNGGTIDTNATYVGYRGKGTALQLGGEHRTGILSVGTEDVPNEPLDGQYILYGSTNPASPSRIDAGTVVIGREPGTNGWLNVAATTTNPHAELISDITLVGIRGSGTVDHSGGLHQIQSLRIGEDSTGMGTYYLRGTGALNASSTVVGVNGTGTFLQTGGIHSVLSLSVNSGSTYTLHGGTLVAKRITSEGTFEIASGSTVSSSLESVTMSGTLDFENASATLTFATGGFGDFAGTTVLNGANASINMGAGGLLVVDPTMDTLITSGGLDVTTVDQPYHVAGQTLTIDQHTISLKTPTSIPGPSSTTTIRDFVEVLHNGSTHGELRSIQSVNLEKGIKVTAGGVVNLGSLSTLTVASAAPTSQIDASVNTFRAHRIEIMENGTLQAVGTLGVNSDLFNAGRFGVGISEPGGALAEIRNSFGSGQFVNDENAIVELDLDNNGADRIAAGTFILDGTLELNVDPSLVSELPSNIGERYSILETHSAAFDSVVGNFEQVIITGASFQDLYDIGLALAVDYVDHSIVLGERLSSGVAVEVAIPGDYNLDGMVSSADLQIVSGNWGSTSATWAEGDVDGNGVVDLVDYNAVIAFWGTTSGAGSGATLAAVPESATLSLIGLATTGLVGAIRRRG